VSTILAALDVPIFIVSRDRLTPLQRLVSWLERVGCVEIYILDNDSAYEPLLEWYRESPHTVLALGQNYGKNALWLAPGVFDRVRGRRFVYSDPDIVPDESCPLDALDRFGELLDRYLAVTKAGFGLRIDDLPDHYPHKSAVLAWERRFWDWPLGRGAYYAPIDTTFALYRPGSGARPNEAVRTGPPYVARHDSWYLDIESLPDDELCYRSRCAADTHAVTVTNWTRSELADGFEEWLAEEGRQASSRVRRVETRLRWLLRGRRTVRRPTSARPSGESTRLG
jgi:hypothetical protein